MNHRFFAAFGIVALGLASNAIAQSFAHGRYTFHATTAGAADDLDVLVDIARPEIQLMAPVDGSRLGGTSTTVTGAVLDFSGVDPETPGHVFRSVDWSLQDGRFGAFVASGSAPVVDGHFVIPDLPLLVGENALQVSARDAAGWTNSSETVFEVDPNAPTAALVGFRDGEAVLDSRIQVDLNFAAPTTIVSLNGAPDGRSFPAGLTFGAFDLPLAFGPNVFSLELESGNEHSTFTFTFYRVESRQPIAIVDPVDRALTNTTTAMITVRAPLGTPFVTVNGHPAVRGDDLQTFAAEVPLNEGTNTITAVAYPFGQRASIRLVRDTTPPRVIALVPEDGRTILGAFTTIQGVASEAAFMEVTSNVDFRQGRTIPILAPTQSFFAFTPLQIHTFEFPFFGLESGVNEIFIRLTDRAGNSTEQTLHLTQTDSALRLLDPPPEGSNTDLLETTLRLEAVQSVALRAIYIGGRLLPSFRSRTLTPGIAQYDHVPLVPGDNQIRVVYERFDTHSQEVLTALISSFATPTATLRGRITDAATGSPLAGATITVTPEGAQPVVITTAADGRYLTTIPTGAYSVSVSQPGFLPASGTDVAALGEIIETDHTMLRWSTGILPAASTGAGTASSHLEGFVMSAADGQPLAGALVRVISGNATQTATSANDGVFSVDGIPVGPFSVAISKTGFFPVQYEIDETQAVDVRLSPSLSTMGSTGTVVVNVRSGTAPGAEAGVRVELVGSPFRALTDSTGRIVLSDVPVGQQTLQFEKPGFPDEFFLFTAAPRADGTPQLVEMIYPTTPGKGNPLRVSPSFEGTVEDLFAGSPLQGATIHAGTHMALSDASGRFQLSGLEIGDVLSLEASAAGHDPRKLDAIVMANGSDPVEFRLRSTERGFLQGTVRDATTHQALAGALVRIAGSGALVAGTDGQGRYTVPAVPPGSYTIEVSHPNYLSTSSQAVVIVNEQGTTFDVEVAHRPATGSLMGRVTNAATSGPVAGAQVVIAGGPSSTTEADGRYLIHGVPAGMVEISVHASGFPDTTRATPVKADTDGQHTEETVLDVELTADGVFSSEASADIDVSTGGTVVMLDGRLRVDVPPFSLTEDARLTLRLAETQHVLSGQVMSLDPALHAPEVRAVGPELLVRLEARSAGAPAPKFLGPIVLTLRYSAAEASAAGVQQDRLFPFWFDGTHFTILRTVPYFYAVDEIDKLVVVALDFTATERGAPVEVAASLRGSALYADASDPNTPLEHVRDFFVHLGATIAGVFNIAPTAEVRDLKDATVDGSVPVNPNALPLLIFHGWDTSNILFNSDPLETDEIGDTRYGTMIGDLLLATNGVYRPIFVTYNTRAPVEAAVSSIYTKLHGALGDGGDIHGQLPEGNHEGKAQFHAMDSLGFSKGGQAERSFQCRSGMVQGMVAIAAPHHGALQNLVNALTVMGYFDFLRDLMKRVSPGTAELLDYDDDDSSQNPYLYNLNRDSCSSPRQRLSLIAGTDSTSFVSLFTEEQLDEVVNRLIASGKLTPQQQEDLTAIESALSAGGLAVSFTEQNDTVVPVFSATARTHAGDRVQAFDGLSEGDSLNQYLEHFSHTTMGAEGSSVRISDILSEVLPPLSDWVVERSLDLPTFRPPSSTQSGSYKAEILVDYHVPGESITGVVAVVYGKDVTGKWHVLDGADPDSLEPSEASFTIDGVNSNAIEDEDERTIHVDVTIPEVVPNDPSTSIVSATVVPVVLPIDGDDGKVPADPTKLEFGLP